MPFFLMTLLMLLAGCATGDSSTAVILQLPQTLAKARFRRFTERATALEIRWETKAGQKRAERFPPAQWDCIHLPKLDFPAAEDDALTLHVQVWDNKTDGTPRAEPVLKGTATLGAKDVENGKARLRVKLSLQVSPGEYDG